MINNILEMRDDYNIICERVSVLRDIPTKEERIKEAKSIIKEHKLEFFVYALVDMIGREFL